MTTTKSYSNGARFGALYRSAFKTQLPFLTITAIAMVLVLTLASFVRVESMVRMSHITELPAGEASRLMSGIYRFGIYGADDSMAMLVVLLLALLSVLSVMVGLNYLHRRRTVDLYHALPVRRSMLLGANLLASLTAVAGPFVVVYLGTALAHVAVFGGCGGIDTRFAQFLAVDCLNLLVYIAAVCVLTAFVAVNVGTLFDTFFITGAMGFLPIIAGFSGVMVWQELTYGAAEPISESMLLSLSPFLFPLGNYALQNKDYAADFTQPAVVALVWLLITALLALLTVRLYNRRKSEWAEQAGSCRVLQITTKCLAGLCGGVLLFFIFDSYNYSFPIRLLAMLLGSLFVGIVAEVILSRGVRGLPRSLVWLAGSGVAFCLLTMLIRADVVGYETRLPAPESVQSVTVNYRGRFESQTQKIKYTMQGGGYSYSSSDSDVVLTDPQSVATVLDMHRRAVEDIVRHEDREEREDDIAYCYLNVSYTLQNGKTMNREFQTMNLAAYQALVSLEDKDDFIRGSHAVFFTQENPELTQAEQISYISVQDNLGLNTAERVFLTEQELNKLLDAVRFDLLDEAFAEIVQPAKPALGYIQLHFKDWYNRPTDMDCYYSEGTGLVLVNESYAQTIKVLRELELYDAMVADPGQVDRAYVFPSNNITYGTMTTLPADESPMYEYVIEAYRRGDTQYLEEYYSQEGVVLIGEVEASAAIQKMVESSKSQLYAGGGTKKPNLDYFLVAFASGDRVTGYKYVPADAIPDEAKEVIIQYFRQEQAEASGQPGAGAVVVVETTTRSVH